MDIEQAVIFVFSENVCSTIVFLLVMGQNVKERAKQALDKQVGAS